MDKLTLDYEDGGLKLPNFQMYYYADQSRFLAQMFDTGPPPSWLNIERIKLKEYKCLKKTIKTATDNPLIIHSIQLWYKICELFKIEGFPSPKTSLWGNKLLPMILESGNLAGERYLPPVIKTGCLCL